MYSYSKKSKEKLAQCNTDLQMIFNKAITFYDHTVLEGHRGKERQNELYRQGKSNVQWPDGNHNKEPSDALDAAPYPIDWSNSPKNTARFYHFAGFIKGLGAAHGIKIRWGGDWDGDNDFTDQTFDDLVHFERK